MKIKTNIDTDIKVEAVQDQAAKPHPTRWKPGQSGNPKGRPKRGETYRDILHEFFAADDDGKTRKQRLIESMYRKATEDGDVPAAKLLLSYAEGLPAQRIEADVTGNLESSPQFVAIRTALLQLVEKHPELEHEVLQITENAEVVDDE